jgi:phosphoglycolate phosphatase
VATVKPTPIAEKVLTDLDLRSHFDGVAGASMGPERRDKSSIIAWAMESFALQSEHSIMVGDRDQDVHGARANGLRAVGVTYGFGSAEEIAASRPDFIEESSGRIHRLLKG